MTLPAIRLATLRQFACAPSITAGLKDALLGRSLILPAELPPAEREEIVDLLALFLDLDVQIVARPEDAKREHLVVLANPLDEGAGAGAALGAPRRSPPRLRGTAPRSAR